MYSWQYILAGTQFKIRLEAAMDTRLWLRPAPEFKQAPQYAQPQN